MKSVGRAATEAIGGGEQLGGPREQTAWLTACGPVPLSRPLVMGIINVTPDSFWDGGRLADCTAAADHAEQLLKDGADLLDIGGESTRPGASDISETEERERVLPVVQEILRRRPGAVISIDTVKAGVADAVLEAGAAIINDVSALRLDPELGAVAASHGAGLVLMHSRGEVEEMASYRRADYGPDPVAEVAAELSESLAAARARGVSDDSIVLDPGLGFSKRTPESAGMIAALPRLLAIGRPVLVGPSRKRFIGELGGGLPPEERLSGTIAACVVALLYGASIFRVHDVRAVRRALDVASAIHEAGG